MRVRVAEAGEAEAIADVMAAAFGFRRGSDKWRSRAAAAHASPGNHLVVEDGGRIVGALCITPGRYWIGEAQITKADVGHVGVLPELQGRGIGSLLMSECVRILAERGFHLSRLGGLCKFYERFGYRPVPRVWYVAEVEPITGGAGLWMPEDLYPPSELERIVRHYEPRRDFHACRKLLADFYRGLPGAPVLDHDPSAPAPEGGPEQLSFVYDDGQVRGFVRAAPAGAGKVFDPCDPPVLVDEAAYEAGRPEALFMPVQRLLLEAWRHGVRRVGLRLPLSRDVQDALARGRVRVDACEQWGGPAASMVAVTNLAGLLAALQPVLSARWAQAGLRWRGQVALRCGQQAAVLRFGEEDVEVAPGAAEPAEEVEVPAGWLAMMIVGLRSFAEVAPGGVGREAAAALGAIFPRTDCLPMVLG